MSELLKRENIIIEQSVDNWEKAIETAVAPLVKNGYVEDRYTDEIVNNTYKYGPYYVIPPNIALLHARPEQGAIKTQIGILILRQPIKFSPNGYDVKLLLTFATTDNVSHLDMLQKIGKIFSDKKATEKIIDSNSIDEIYSFFSLVSDE